MTLTQIIQQNHENLSSGHIVCLLDEQGHRCVLYQTAPEKGVALQYEKGFCPFVFPEPSYIMKGLLPLKDWALWLKGTLADALAALEDKN